MFRHAVLRIILMQELWGQKLTMAKGGESNYYCLRENLVIYLLLGNHNFMQYIDATSQAMYILKQGAYPTISVFITI